MRSNRTRSWQWLIKSALDYLGGWLLFLLASPLMWLLAALIKIDSPGPAFFRQERIGQYGRPFISVKFRSMVQGAEKMKGVPQVRLVTRLGHYLRLLSLDELPQLFNVINGQMSLIGPRPTLRYQVEAYDDFQRRRLEVKPGITGWAQVNGRNSIPWEERIKLDIWYIDHWSLKLDLEILARTWRAVWRQEGIYGPGGLNYDFRGSATSSGRKQANCT